jgi:hypothetical protein
LSYKFDYYKGVYSANGKITALGGVKEWSLANGTKS